MTFYIKRKFVLVAYLFMFCRFTTLNKSVGSLPSTVLAFNKITQLHIKKVRFVPMQYD
jgi:hypothetical protein